MGLLDEKSSFPGDFRYDGILEYEGLDPLDHNYPYFIDNFNESYDDINMDDLEHFGFKEEVEYPIDALINLKLDSSVHSNKIRHFLNSIERINENDRLYLNSINFNEENYAKYIDVESLESTGAELLLYRSHIHTIGELALADYQSIFEHMDYDITENIKEIYIIGKEYGFELRCENPTTKEIVDSMVSDNISSQMYRIIKNRIKYNFRNKKREARARRRELKG